MRKGKTKQAVPQIDIKNNRQSCRFKLIVKAIRLAD